MISSSLRSFVKDVPTQSKMLSSYQRDFLIGQRTSLDSSRSLGWKCGKLLNPEEQNENKGGLV